jgi:hypothetical protein
MKKIRLNAEELEVLSFSTAPMPQARGTVAAAASGYTCYVTVAVYQTRCLAYPQSYWNENTCYCPIEPYTQQLQCQPIQTADLTCLTCPGQPGC